MEGKAGWQAYKQCKAYEFFFCIGAKKLLAVYLFSPRTLPFLSYSCSEKRWAKEFRWCAIQNLHYYLHMRLQRLPSRKGPWQ